jgi:hypothetical protein
MTVHDVVSFAVRAVAAVRAYIHKVLIDESVNSMLDTFTAGHIHTIEFRNEIREMKSPANRVSINGRSSALKPNKNHEPYQAKMAACRSQKHLLFLLSC